VDAAGAEHTVTDDVPLSAPSFDPSENVVPLLSAYATVKSGFVVVAAPDITAVIVLVVASRTNFMETS
jgi:hypothetical protein